MPYNGAGLFTPVYNWETDATNGVLVRADRMDGQDTDIASGLSNCITKDGQQTLTANIPMGGFKLTGLGAGTQAQDSVRVSDLQGNTYLSYTASGTNAYAITPVPAVTSYATNQTWFVKFTNANTTTAVTIAVSGLAIINIVKNGATSLAVGDISAGQIYILQYDGVNFQILGRISPVGVPMAPGGLQTANFAAASNTSYQMKCNAVSIVAQLPVGARGDNIYLSAYGAVGGQMCGTINGVAITIPFGQQSLWLQYAPTAGWV